MTLNSEGVQWHEYPGLQPQQWRTLTENDPWGCELYGHMCYKASISSLTHVLLLPALQTLHQYDMYNNIHSIMQGCTSSWAGGASINLLNTILFICTIFNSLPGSFETRMHSTHHVNISRVTFSNRLPR